MKCQNQERYLLPENPLSPRARELMPWFGVDFVSAMTRQCSEGSGLVDFLGDPVKKPARLLSKAIMIGKELSKVRCKTGHIHASLIN